MGEGYPWRIQLFQPDLILIQPVAVRLAGTNILLKLFVADDPSLLHIHYKHFTRLQPAVALHYLRVNRQSACFGSHDHAVIMRNAKP